MKGDSYPCPQCEKTFSRQQHVHRHLRTHTGECPFECQLCTDKFQRADMLTRHHAKIHPSEPVPNTTSTATATQPPSQKRKRPKQEEPTSPARSNAPVTAASVVESSNRPGPSAPKHTRRSKYVEMAGELQREMQQGGLDAVACSSSSGLYGDLSRRPPEANELPLQPFPGSFATEPCRPSTMQQAAVPQAGSSYVPPGLVDPTLLMEHWDRHHPGFAGSLSSVATGVDPVDTLMGVISGSTTGVSTGALVGAPYEFDGRTWGVEQGEELGPQLENVDWNAMMTGFDGTADGAGDVDWQSVEAGMADQAWMAGLLEHDTGGRLGGQQLTIVPPHSGPTHGRQPQDPVGQGEISLLSPPDSATPSTSSRHHSFPSSASTPSPVGDPSALQQYSTFLRNSATAILSSLPPLSIVIRPFERTNAPKASVQPLTPHSATVASSSSTILERRAVAKQQQQQQAVLTMAATATSAAASTAMALTTTAAALAVAANGPSAGPPTPTGWFTLEKKNLIRTRSQKAVDQAASMKQTPAATATATTPTTSS